MNLEYRNIFLTSVFLLLNSHSIFSQDRKEMALQSDLFKDQDVLEIALKMNVKAVANDIEDRDYHHAVLTYYEGEDHVNIPLEVRTRGKTRANPVVCSFPPIRLNFKKNSNFDNLFAGQDKIKLVTHCRSVKTFDQYVLQEYLTYKLYNILTDYSFKVRLLQVSYVDSANTDDSLKHYGILIEDIDLLAYRNGMIEREDPVKNQDFCAREPLDILTVFQYMIGNTDWSISAMHNIKMIAKDSTHPQPIPIPYDFDYAGIISTNYAVVHEDLPIENVRTRLFRGFCRPDGYQEVIKLFNEKKDEIYALYNNFKLLNERNRKSTIKYFDKFYKTINDPKRARRAFNGACRVSHQHFK